jgi:hypothetical protein
LLRLRSLLLKSLTLIAGSALLAGTALVAGTAQASSGPALNLGGPMRAIGSTGALATTSGIRNQAQSTNWSGYAATGRSFTSVSANWKEPTGICHRGAQYSAFWVGIDGYSSSTVEQTGSSVDCSGSTARYYTWYEMYPGPSQTYSDTVHAGDNFTATVTYLGGQNFSLHIADTTRGWSHTTDASLGSTPALSSAEVIVEAPCCTSGGGILPLADFGTMSFTGSTANGSAIGNDSPTQIVMVDGSGRAKDSISSLTTGENFSATWLRSN